MASYAAKHTAPNRPRSHTIVAFLFWERTILLRIVLNNFPIRLPTSKQQEQKIISLVDEMLELQKKLHESDVSGYEKERLESKIKDVDYEINKQVYDLYEITPEERKIIEDSLK